MENDSLLLLLASLLFLALFILGVKDIEISGKRAQYAQVLFTLLAFVTTAYWFFVERKGMPHADVTQKIEVMPLGRGIAAVEAHIQIKNLGQRLLTIDRISSSLQAVTAEAYGYADLPKKAQDQDYWQARRPSGADQFHYAELRWPIMREYDEEVDYRIEPGETDLIVVTFLVNCSTSEWVRVASDIYKPSTSATLESGEEAEEFAWKTRSFAKLGEACSETGEKAG